MKAVYAHDRRAKLLLDAETKSLTVLHISFLSSFCFISVLHLAFPLLCSYSTAIVVVRRKAQVKFCFETISCFSNASHVGLVLKNICSCPPQPRNY